MSRLTLFCLGSLRWNGTGGVRALSEATLAWHFLLSALASTPSFSFLQEAFYQQVTHTLDPISYALLDLPQVLVL